MSFFFIICPKAQITVSAERWFDARRFARDRFPDHTRVDLAPPYVHLADFEIRWSGKPPNQRMEVRARDGEWEAA